MQIRNLGGSGLRVSAVGLGCNNFGQRIDLEASRKVIHRAIDLGVTLFDTADIYAGMGGSETVLGQVLGDRRKDIVLATKYSKPMSSDGTKQGASRRYILSAVEASLTRLKTDYIDLYQQHDYDTLTPIEHAEISHAISTRIGRQGIDLQPRHRVGDAVAAEVGVQLRPHVGVERDVVGVAQQRELGMRARVVGSHPLPGQHGDRLGQRGADGVGDRVPRRERGDPAGDSVGDEVFRQPFVLRVVALGEEREVGDGRERCGPGARVARRDARDERVLRRVARAGNAHEQFDVGVDGSIDGSGLVAVGADADG